MKKKGCKVDFLMGRNGKYSYKRVCGFLSLLFAFILAYTDRTDSIGLVSVFVGLTASSTAATVFDKKEDKKEEDNKFEH